MLLNADFAPKLWSGSRIARLINQYDLCRAQESNFSGQN